MASNDVPPPKRIAQEHTWQTLIEFTLSGESDSERLAADRVAEAMQKLNWPAALQERLRLALAKSARNALERSRLDGSEASLIVRVLVPESSETTEEGGQAGNEPGQGGVSARVARQVRRPSSRGWGFFLVQKQEDNPQASAGKSYHLIELFLYQEREHARTYKSNHLT
ncbi:MAG: hypothetical protein BroJett011_47180 [Chloroflexota bacterium]|nr:MAG: hypothetical protein BroJett011_47180 [Chloroflexota bacterium]